MLHNFIFRLAARLKRTKQPPHNLTDTDEIHGDWPAMPPRPDAWERMSHGWNLDRHDQRNRTKG